jgi:hypothetical protein
VSSAHESRRKAGLSGGAQATAGSALFSLRSEHNAGYYAACVADFDGNAIEAVHRVAADELVAA